MKKLSLLVAIVCLVSSIYAAGPSGNNPAENSDVNDRALAHFRANYSDAENATWSKTTESTPYCHFHRGDEEVQVFYEASGNWEYTMGSYAAARLESDLVAKIQRRFPKYKIQFVNEILSDMDAVYIVNIEDEGHIKVIEMMNDMIMVTQSLNKQRQ